MWLNESPVLRGESSAEKRALNVLYQTIGNESINETLKGAPMVSGRFMFLIGGGRRNLAEPRERVGIRGSIQDGGRPGLTNLSLKVGLSGAFGCDARKVEIPALRSHRTRL